MTMLLNPYRYGGSGGGGSFSPLDISWHAAFWAEDPNWTPPADGAAVSQWDDASGNGRHATQATGSKQPVYRASATKLNNQPAVQGDAADDALATASWTALSQPVTVASIFAYRTIGFGRGASMVFDGITSSNRQTAFHVGSNNDLAIFAGTALTDTATVQDTDAHLWIATFDTTDTLEEDGTTLLSGSAGSQTLTGITLFSDFGQTARMDGWISFLGVKNGTLTAQEKADLRSWSQSHYGTP